MTIEELRDSYDWKEAFSYGSYKPDDVAEIIATSVEYGDYAETDCLGLFKMKDGKYAKVFASCDTTGWDCQAGGNTEAYDTLEELLSPQTLMEKERARLKPDLEKNAT